MSHPILVYKQVTINGETDNVPDSVVERDENGQINVSICNVAGQLILGGGISVANEVVAGNITLDDTASIVKANCTTAALTITMPPAAVAAEQLITIIKVDNTAHIPTVKGNGSELLVTSNTYAALTAQGSFVTFYSDGTQWWIVAKG